MALPLLLGAAALGVGKNIIEQRAAADRERKQRELAAQTAAWSPWTGMNPASIDIPQAPTMAGAITGGLGEGIGMGANLASLNQQAEMSEAYKDWLNRRDQAPAQNVSSLQNFSPNMGMGMKRYA